MCEEWRPVVGWESLYEVSDQGHVRSASKTIVRSDGKVRRFKSRVLSTKTTEAGYLLVKLLSNRTQSNQMVDRLVASAFLPNDNGFQYVGHRNGSLEDNRVENLFWCDLDGLSDMLDKESARDSITLPDERWADIDGYVGSYQISSCGRVFSVPRYRDKNGFPCLFGGNLVKTSMGTNGYVNVKLFSDSKYKTYSVHRLVATAFVANPNPDEYVEVNHIDEDKTNNSYLNLEWCSRLQNIRHGTGIQRASAKRDYKHIGEMVRLTHDFKAIAKKRSKSVLQFDLDGSLVKVWESASEIQRTLGFYESSISRACKRTGNGALLEGIAYGYKWYYEEDYGCVA